MNELDKINIITNRRGLYYSTDGDKSAWTPDINRAHRMSWLVALDTIESLNDDNLLGQVYIQRGNHGQTK